MAKMCLRGVNFSCSLIVVSMISATFTIFNASRNLPNRGKLSPWAPKQQIWPQITLLCIASVSLVMAIGILYAYWRGGHRRAEKAAVYYTVFAIGFFFFSIIIWAIGAAILNEQKRHGKNKDMWGWACKEGKRKEVFGDNVDYGLVCRMQVRTRTALSGRNERWLMDRYSIGHLSVLSSRLSSKSSPSPSTASSSIATTPNVASTSRWTFATVLAPISTSPSSVANPLPTPLASKRPRCPLRSHPTSTATTSAKPRTANTTAPSTPRNGNRPCHNPNPSPCNRRPSASSTPHRQCHKTALSPRNRKSTSRLRRANTCTKPCLSQVLMLVRWRVLALRLGIRV